MNRQPDQLRKKPFGPLFVFLFFLAWCCFYSLFVRGIPPNGDPVNYFIVAQNIADGGAAAFDSKHRFVPLVEGRGGKFYSKFAPGQSLLEVPFYLFARAAGPESGTGEYIYSSRYFVTALSVPAVSALAIVFFLLLLAELGYSRKTALAASTALGLATIAWPYAKSGFSEPLQACALAAAFLYAARSAKGGAGPAAACGAAAGVLLLAKAAGAVVAPVLFFYILFASGREGRTGVKPAAAFAAVFGVFLLGSLYYNYYRFGGWFEFGYSGGRDSAMGFGVSPLTGLYGLLLSPGKSVFLYSPVLLLALAGTARFHREHRRESLLLWFIAVPWLLLYSRWWAWHGDWSWGPRFLVPLTPLLMLPLAEVLKDFPRWRAAAKAAAVVVVAVSVFVQVPGVSVSFYEYITITRHQVPHNRYFMPGAQGLRDDQLLTHFVPEFSPIAGHWWLFRHALARGSSDRAELRDEMKKDFPWRELMSYAVPDNPVRGARFDFWWVYFPEFFPGSRGWVSTLLAVTAAMTALSLAGCVLVYRKRRR